LHWKVAILFSPNRISGDIHDIINIQDFDIILNYTTANSPEYRAVFKCGDKMNPRALVV